jgi:hypothetical protein
MTMLIDTPAPYIVQRPVSVREALDALPAVAEDLARIRHAVDTADGATLPPAIAAEYRAMQRHLREATVALAREDLKGARYDEQQGRDCLSRVAAYLLSLGDETITAALERMNHE